MPKAASREKTIWSRRHAATVAAGAPPLNARALESSPPALATMAKAGALYEVETGNIWGYAHRVRAADVLQDLTFCLTLMLVLELADTVCGGRAG